MLRILVFNTAIRVEQQPDELTPHCASGAYSLFLRILGRSSRRAIRKATG